MKTSLFNPIFINPLAYFVFPQLYDITPELEVLIEPCVFTGTLMVQTSDNTVVRFYENTKSIDLTEFANSTVTISLYTDVGATVLGKWVLYGKSTPTVHPNLIDAWFMSGLKNEDKPAYIEGVKGNKLVTNNFVFNEISGFNGLGALVFDGVDDFLVCDTMPIMTDYTVIACREWLRKSNTISPLLSKRTFGDANNGAFTFERASSSLYQTLSFGGITNVPIYPNKVIYQTKSKYNGIDTILTSTQLDTNKLTVATATGHGYANIRVSWFAIYDRTLTKEEIDKEIVELEKEHNKRLKL